MARWVKRPTLGFSPGHDLRVLFTHICLVLTTAWRGAPLLSPLKDRGIEAKRYLDIFRKGIRPANMKPGLEPG